MRTNQWPPQQQSPGSPFSNTNQYNQPPQTFSPQTQNRQNEQITTLIKKLSYTPKERGEALSALCAQRKQIPDLAIMLWYSPATVSALLSEVISIYPFLSSGNLNIPLTNRVCDILTLFQVISADDETRMMFVNANIPIYLFPFLHHSSQNREAEYFKITVLGIIGNLVKNDQPEIIEYLLHADFVPLCLRTLKYSQEVTRTVAGYILSRILDDAGGLKTICSNKEKAETVVEILNKVLLDLCTDYSSRLAKNVISAYQSLINVQEISPIIIYLQSDELKNIQIPSQCDESFRELIIHLKGFWSKQITQKYKM